jgi:hypothetical protein
MRLVWSRFGAAWEGEGVITTGVRLVARRHVDFGRVFSAL